MDIREILIASGIDGTPQPSLFFHPGGDKPVPRDFDILSTPDKSHGCANICFGRGRPAAIRNMGQ